MDYDVYVVERILNPDYGTVSGDQYIGGDDHHLRTFTTIRAALTYGEKLSYEKKVGSIRVHEIYIRSVDQENDKVSVWYIKDGVITHNDVG